MKLINLYKCVIAIILHCAGNTYAAEFVALYTVSIPGDQKITFNTEDTAVFGFSAEALKKASCWHQHESFSDRQSYGKDCLYSALEFPTFIGEIVSRGLMRQYTLPSDSRDIFSSFLHCQSRDPLVTICFNDLEKSKTDVTIFDSFLPEAIEWGKHFNKKICLRIATKEALCPDALGKLKKTIKAQESYLTDITKIEFYKIGNIVWPDLFNNANHPREKITIHPREEINISPSPENISFQSENIPLQDVLHFSVFIMYDQDTSLAERFLTSSIVFHIEPLWKEIKQTWDEAPTAQQDRENYQKQITIHKEQKGKFREKEHQQEKKIEKEKAAKRAKVIEEKKEEQAAKELSGKIIIILTGLGEILTELAPKLSLQENLGQSAQFSTAITQLSKQNQNEKKSSNKIAILYKVEALSRNIDIFKKKILNPPTPKKNSCRHAMAAVGILVAFYALYYFFLTPAQKDTLASMFNTSLR